MNKDEAIKELIVFAKESYDLYGEELECNLLERAVGDEYRSKMKEYEKGKEKLFELIYAITKEQSR